MAILLGCTDAGATNYDKHATRDDGMCCGPGSALGVACPGQNPKSGCTDPRAENWNPVAAFNDGSCCGRFVGVECKTEPPTTIIQNEQYLNEIMETGIPYDGMGGRPDPRTYFYNVETGEVRHAPPEGSDPMTANALRQAAADAAFRDAGSVWDAPRQYTKDASADDASASTFDVAGNVVGSGPTKLAAEHSAVDWDEAGMHSAAGVDSAGVEVDPVTRVPVAGKGRRTTTETTTETTTTSASSSSWEDVDWAERRRRRKLRAMLKELESDHTLRNVLLRPPPLTEGA